jgi:molybdopterin converting factor small subunit
MGINVIIHKTHQIFTNGSASVLVEGKTTGECLQDLVTRFPDMKRVLFNARGELLNTIEVCINHQSTYPEQLTSAVSDGDEIQLILFFAGG